MTGPGAMPVLRPLGAGERIDAAIKIYRRNFLTMAKAMLVVAVPTGVVTALVTLSTSPATTALPSTTPSAPFAITSVNSTTLLGGDAVTQVVGLVAGAIGTATVFWVVITAYLGHPASWRTSLRVGLRRMWSVLWITVLTLVAMVVPAVAVGGVVGGLFASGARPAGGVALLLLGPAFLVFVVWFWTFSRLAVPCLLLEDVRGWAAVRRSFHLVRGQWWSVFGTQVLAAIIQDVATTVAAVPVAVAVVVTAHSDLARVAFTILLEVLITVLVQPFTAAVYVVLAIDAKVRKEGFDLEVLAGHVGVAPTATALSFLTPRPPPPGWGPPPYRWGPPPGPGGPAGWGTPGGWGPPGGSGAPGGWGASGAWGAPGGWGPPAGPGWGGTAPGGPGWGTPLPPSPPAGRQWPEPPPPAAPRPAPGPQSPPQPPPPSPAPWWPPAGPPSSPPAAGPGDAVPPASPPAPGDPTGP